jgi:triosephosphate isomerase
VSADARARIPLVAANWKMHKTMAEAEAFCRALLPQLDGLDAEVVICPPFLALSRVVEVCGPSPVKVAAQNMHYEQEGAFTGEVSAPMLLDAGAAAVLLGHSERRQLLGETDLALSHKVPAALAAGLLPILCCGETEDQRDAGQMEVVLRGQIEADLIAVEAGRLADVVIAYEPIWAIGTGRTATAEQAAEACGFIRSLIASRDGGAAERLRILYGGSVKPANAEELLGREQIDGALVGGASLDPDEFAAIVAAAPAAGRA